MKNLFVLLVSFLIGISSAFGADCTKQISADKPLWGNIGEIVALSLSPVTEYNEIAKHGPGVKYTYTVRFANSLHFKSWSVLQKDALLKPGYKFAWIPKNPDAVGRNPADQFFPTAYNESCESIRLDSSWNFDDLVGTIH